MKRMKKAIVFLIVAITLSVTVSFLWLASAKETKLGVDQTSPLSVEVTTAKSKYTLLSVIEFNVRITNNSDTDIENIDVVAQLGQDLVFVKGSEIKTSKKRLAPGEVYEWSYKAKVNRNCMKGADKLLVPLAFMRDIFIGDYSDNNQDSNFGSHMCKSQTRATLISAYSNTYSSDSTVKVFYDANSVEFGYLHTNPTNCDAGVSSDVTFFINITSEGKIEDESIELYFDDKLLGSLNDSGENGDAQSNDGVYSGTFSVFSNERKHSQYYVKYKNQKSDIETLLFAKPRTEEEIQIINDFNSDISKIKEKYTFSREKYNNKDKEALLKAKQCYNDITSYLDNRSDVKSYEFTGFNIMVMFDFEIPVGISFDDLIQDTDKKLQSRSLNQINNISYNDDASYKSKIITLQPHSDELPAKAFDNAADTIINSNSNYIFQENLDNEQVTIETMKSLSKYGIIIIDSHGGNWAHNGYILSLSETVTISKDKQYEEDIDKERIIPTASNYLVTEKFFDDYYSADDLNNTIIYLGTCHGGDDNVGIRRILNSKGAEAVMSYKNTVVNKYNHEMITTISKQLSEGDTIQEAVEKAKEENGIYDPYITDETYDDLSFWEQLWYLLGLIDSSDVEGANPSELILTGNDTSFALSKNPGSELITGQVIDSKDNNPISNVNVTCPELNINCLTDKNGIFEFKVQLPLKQTTFYFSHEDYKDNTIMVTENDYSSLNQISLTPKEPDNPPMDDNFAGGDGTIENPYQIATARQLDAVRNHLDSNFVLVDDIDLSEYENWEPIGGYIDVEPDDGLQGSFDGQGHTISNLTMKYIITPTEQSYPRDYSFGLFSDSTLSPGIQNVNLENVNIDISGKGDYTEIKWGSDVYVSGVSTKASILSNISADGQINVKLQNDYTHISGITCNTESIVNSTNKINTYAEVTGIRESGLGVSAAGITNSAVNISNCNNYGHLSVNTTSPEDSTWLAYAGNVSCAGIITGAVDSEISNSKNYGDIDVVSKNCHLRTGGIAGSFDGGTISNCVNYGLVKSNTYKCSSVVGGIVGYLGNASNISTSTINKCVNFGNLSSVCTLPENLTADNAERGYAFCSGIVGDIFSSSSGNGKIDTCFNLAEKIEEECRNTYFKEHLGRISRNTLSIDGKSLMSNCYSLDSTLLNGVPAAEDIGPDQKNGGSMTRAEIEKAVTDLGFALPGQTE